MFTLSRSSLAIMAILLVAGSCATEPPNSPDRQTEAQGSEVSTMRIEGIPTTYGSEPRTYVAIVVYGSEDEEQRSFYVHPDMQDELRSMTGNRYVFTGHLYTGEERFFDARLHDGVFVPESWEPAK